MLNIWYANDLPYGPRPIWVRAHMGQGPYGPRPVWAKAHTGLIWAPGPWAPGPSLLSEHLTKKRTLARKKSQNCVFCVFFLKQKRCATSARSFWRRYCAEISAMCQKTKVSVFEKRQFCVRRCSALRPAVQNCTSYLRYKHQGTHHHAMSASPDPTSVARDALDP